MVTIVWTLYESVEQQAEDQIYFTKRNIFSDECIASGNHIETHNRIYGCYVGLPAKLIKDFNEGIDIR